MSIAVVGSIAFDTVETPAGRLERALGGAAIYFSTAASLFHRPVHLIGVVGDDFPEEVFARLSARGIDASGVARAGGETFHWYGAYEGDMSEAQTRGTRLGVFASFRPEPAAVPAADVLFLANIDPEIQGAVLDDAEAGGRPRFVGMDTMNFWIETKREAVEAVIARVDGLFLNEGEARMLTGEALLPAAAEKLLERGVRVVVIKKGPHGALVAARTAGAKDGGEPAFVQIPAVPLARIADPTGAGDSFAGAFCGVWAARSGAGGAESLDLLREAAATASVVASFNCESFSTERLERVTLAEVEKRLSDLRETARF